MALDRVVRGRQASLVAAEMQALQVDERAEAVERAETVARKIERGQREDAN